jgi:hypothetical protein
MRWSAPATSRLTVTPVTTVPQPLRRNAGRISRWTLKIRSVFVGVAVAVSSTSTPIRAHKDFRNEMSGEPGTGSGPFRGGAKRVRTPPRTRSSRSATS